MKVYIVEEIGVHGTGKILAVYDSKEKADNHKWEYPHPMLYLNVIEKEVK